LTSSDCLPVGESGIGDATGEHHTPDGLEAGGVRSPCSPRRQSAAWVDSVGRYAWRYL